MLLNAHLIFAAVIAAGGNPTSDGAVSSRNGEFIFSQYPPRALAAREQGAVRFKAEVDAKGNVLACTVTESSGFKRLDSETCDLIVDHATFKPTLDSEGKARSAVHDGIVNWRIPGAPASATKVAANGRLPDDIVCKRQTKTGSLVSHSRLCLTRRQWAEYAEQNQERWGELQGKYGHTREDQPTFDSGIASPGHLSGGYSPPRF